MRTPPMISKLTQVRIDMSSRRVRGAGWGPPAGRTTRRCNPPMVTAPLRLSGTASAIAYAQDVGGKHGRVDHEVERCG